MTYISDFVNSVYSLDGLSVNLTSDKLAVLTVPGNTQNVVTREHLPVLISIYEAMCADAGLVIKEDLPLANNWQPQAQVGEVSVVREYAYKGTFEQFEHTQFTLTLKDFDRVVFYRRGYKVNPKLETLPELIPVVRLYKRYMDLWHKKS